MSLETIQRGTTSRSFTMAPIVSAQNEYAGGHRRYGIHGMAAWKGVRGTGWHRLRRHKRSRGAEGGREERRLRVQAVLRLIPDDGLRSIDHLIRDLEPAVRGEAVHDDRVLLRLVHEELVDLVRLEDPLPLPLLLLHAHGNPDVRVHDIRPLDGVHRVLQNSDLGARARAHV